MAADQLCSKRRAKTSETHLPLIDGLPDHLAEICLARVGDPSLISSVCNRWRCLIYSPSFPPFMSLYALFVESGSDQPYRSAGFKCSSPALDAGTLRFMSFDPLRSKWYDLPPPPDPPIKRILHRHPSFMSRNLPIQSVSTAGKFVLLAGSTHDLFPAFDRPIVFDTLTGRWSFGPPMVAPRRWCAAGTHGGEVFVASGIGSHFSPQVARSMEKWNVLFDRSQWSWEKVRDMRNGRFSRDAIDAVGWRGRILMVNVTGDAAKEGIVYDIKGDFWSVMPKGMVAGIRGPVAAMGEEELYAVDETKGSLRWYDEERDEWIELVLASEKSLLGAEQMVAAGGKIGVITGRGEIVMVDVTAVPAKVWAVENPPGLKAVAVHILPRMNLSW